MGGSSTIALFPREKVVRVAQASMHLPTATKGSPGVLHLTNQRLVFWPDGNGAALEARLQEVRGSATFARKRLGFIPAGLALRVSLDTRGSRDGTWFLVDDAEGGNAAITKSRADAPPVPDLAALLSAGEVEGKDVVSREAFGHFLLNERGFPCGFWHPDDDDGLLNVFGGWIADAGLPDELMADEKLRAELRRIAESMAEPTDAAEDEARRRQVRCVAERVNSMVGPGAGARRLYQFADDLPGWEPDEPVWLFLNADERARLVALGIVHPLVPAAEGGGQQV
jgi:hypothetical protein